MLVDKAPWVSHNGTCRALMRGRSVCIQTVCSHAWLNWAQVTSMRDAHGGACVACMDIVADLAHHEVHGKSLLPLTAAGSGCTLHLHFPWGVLLALVHAAIHIQPAHSRHHHHHQPVKALTSFTPRTHIRRSLTCTPPYSALTSTASLPLQATWLQAALCTTQPT